MSYMTMGDEIHALRCDRAMILKELNEVKAERTVLAVHVERLRAAFKTSYQTLNWTWVKDVLDEAPTASLARLKAEWQAELLETMLAAHNGSNWSAQQIEDWANYLQRQAKEKE